MKKMDSSFFRFTPQKLFFILITLQFVIAPFYYQPNFGGEGLYLPYNSSVWIVAVWIIASSTYLISYNKTIVLPKYWLGLALLPLCTISTGFLIETINPTEWFVRISVITGGFLFLIGLFQFGLKPKDIDQSLYILLAMGMISASYGLFQLHSTQAIFSFIPFSPSRTPIGIFQQINLQASMMATLLVLVYYLISRPSIQCMSRFIALVLCLTAFTACYIIAASGSRIGLLGCTFGLFVLLLGRWPLFLKRKKLLAIVLLCSAAGFSLQMSGLYTTASKFDRALGGVETDIRWKVYRISWDLFTEAPITGHGLGSFSKVFQEQRGDYQSNNTLNLGNAPRFSHPHNELFIWLVEGGIVSIIGILAASFVTFIQLSKLGWQRGSGYAALLIPIVFHTQVELPFYISNTHWFILLFLLYITHQHKKITYKNFQISTAARVLLVAFFLLLAASSTWSLIHSQIANHNLVKYYQTQQKHPELLEASVNSWYFHDRAKNLSLHHQLKDAILTKDLVIINEFIAHTEGLLKVTPAQEYYTQLINIYHVIGLHERRDQLLTEAMAIYPEHKPLLALHKKISTASNTKRPAP